MTDMLKRLAIVSVVLMGMGCAHSPPDDPQDPLENINRSVFEFNRGFDRLIGKPVAKGYVAITPTPVRRGVNNFFHNLFYPTTIISDFFQLKLVDGVADTARFGINSTFGILGIFDVATPLGLERHNEDPGQVLGRWGVGQGWYLMLPFIGPTTNRDFVAGNVLGFANPLGYMDLNTRVPLTILYAVDIRAALLQTDSVIEASIDPYNFVRGSYLQRRLNDVYDGSPPKDYGYSDGSDNDNDP